MPEAQGSADVHTVPDPRAREGIPLQPLPDATAANRNRARSLPDGTTDQDLVSKSADETEERIEGGERNQRAGKAGTRGAGNDEEAAGGKAGQDAAGAAECGPAASAAAPRKRSRQDTE